MRDMQYYISQPKVDAHNHLNLGMHYNTYLAWSGVSIPDFPRPMDGLDDMHDIIARYTRPRCRSSDDVINLIDMSIRDAIDDGVTVLEGSIDIGFMVHFKGNTDKFLKMTTDFVKKYTGKNRFQARTRPRKNF